MSYDSVGFGPAFNDTSVSIGSITPQKIDGFKITYLQDQYFSEADIQVPDEVTNASWFAVSANRKCVLHIKGKDYRLTMPSGSEYVPSEGIGVIGIEEGEKIKVTYTLL